jgi:hypothetical protein
MISAASVSFTDLICELQKRHKAKQRWDDSAYVESLIFDLHMAQKSLQRSIYNQQVTSINQRDLVAKTRCQTQREKLQSRLDYPER